ncbi:MAG: hypothetical protein JWN48_3992 [Myxococcaceae bacterium]|nr:hypothetical protein [Myxococcaceae bacterium]
MAHNVARPLASLIELACVRAQQSRVSIPSARIAGVLRVGRWVSGGDADRADADPVFGTVFVATGCGQQQEDGGPGKLHEISHGGLQSSLERGEPRFVLCSRELRVRASYRTSGSQVAWAGRKSWPAHLPSSWARLPAAARCLVLTARRLSERCLTDLLSATMEARAEGLVVLRDRDGLRHGLWVEGGYVVGAHVAGRFDPLLELLLRNGVLSATGHRSCIEALLGGAARSGEVATSLAGVPTFVVREALKRQVIERFRALLELSESAGYDAQLEPRAVPPSERSVRMPLGCLLRHVQRAARPSVALEESPTRPTAPGTDQARRALRSLARALHPDLHPHLDAEARARLSQRLASATAAYHGFAAKGS